jgi:hypothetical protein
LSRILPISNGLYTTLNLRPGLTDEPPVSSQEFLLSYLEAGLWLRCLAAQSHINTLSAERSSRLERLAASAGIYTQLGLATEDAIAMLVAWSFWSMDNSVNLVDLIYRISLRVSDEKSGYTALEMTDLKSKVFGSRKIPIDGRRYLRSLTAGIQQRDLPALFGVRWKQNPSVKVVPKEESATWQMLPRSISEYVQILSDARSELSSACYNKLKHGPQLIVGRPSDAAARMGFTEEQYKLLGELELIRILGYGSQIATTHEEMLKGVRRAPFLLDDLDNSRRLFDRAIVATASFMFMLGRYVYGCTFIGSPMPKRPTDPGLVDILERYAATL